MAKTRDELLHAATQAAWAVLKLEKGKGTNQHNANVSTRARDVAKAKAWSAVISADRLAGTTHHPTVTHSHHISAIVDEAYGRAFDLWKAKKLAERAGARF